MPLTVSLSTTELTPDVARATISARSFSALLATVPVSVTTCPSVDTLISLAFTTSSAANLVLTAAVSAASVWAYTLVVKDNASAHEQFRKFFNIARAS